MVMMVTGHLLSVLIRCFGCPILLSSIGGVCAVSPTSNLLIMLWFLFFVRIVLLFSLFCDLRGKFTP